MPNSDFTIKSDAWLCPECGPITNISRAGRPTCQECGSILETGEGIQPTM